MRRPTLTPRDKLVAATVSTLLGFVVVLIAFGSDAWPVAVFAAGLVQGYLWARPGNLSDEQLQRHTVDVMRYLTDKDPESQPWIIAQPTAEAIATSYALAWREAGGTLDP